jgi:hypothetical protein
LDIVLEAPCVVVVAVVVVGVAGAGVAISVDGDDSILTFRLKANFVFPAVDERNSSSDLSNALSCFSILLT